MEITDRQIFVALTAMCCRLPFTLPDIFLEILPIRFQPMAALASHLTLREFSFSLPV